MLRKTTLLHKALILILGYFSNSISAHRQDVCASAKCENPKIKNCYAIGDQLLEISSDSYLILNCKAQSPNSKLFSCADTKNVLSIDLKECKFSSIEMKSFLQSVPNVNQLRLDYRKNEILEICATFNDLPYLKYLSIEGSRTGGEFNISFDQGMTSLTELSIVNHDFKTFPKLPFQQLTNLMALRLVNGPIDKLSTDIFYGLTNLKMLSLSSNQITELKSDLFVNVPKLSLLILSWNDIQELPKNQFSNMKYLTSLDISHNEKVTTLPVTLLSGMKELLKFNASSCSLKDLDPAFFSNILTKSTMHTLSLFYQMKERFQFDMKNNGISSPSLTNSDLWRLFHIRASDSIQLNVLDLSHNQLSVIKETTFDKLINLDMIDLSYNPLTKLPKSFPFGQSKRLHEIRIRNCELTEMPFVDFVDQGLKILDVSYNKLVNATLPLETKLDTKVLLNNNSIQLIKLDFSVKSESTPTYYLEGNSLSCNCSLKDFFKFFHRKAIAKKIFPDASAVTCSDLDKKVTEIMPTDINCVVPRCPQPCDCGEKEWGKVKVDCSNKLLHVMPEVIPSETNELYLDNNKFTRLSHLKGDGWMNLVLLSLSNNNLRSLKGWRDFRKLRTLNLSQNLLLELPTSLLGTVNKIPNFEIYLAGNKWNCNCKYVYLIEWMNSNMDKIKDYGSVDCTLEDNGTYFKELIENTPIISFCNVTTTVFGLTTEELTLSMILFIGVLTLLTIMVILYSYRHTLLTILYANNMYFPIFKRGSVSKEIVFDVFICFTFADRKFVKSIVHSLEKIKRVCVHRRDKVPVEGAPAEITFSIINSQNTLLVISKKFVHSTLFQRDFRRAFRRLPSSHRRKIILVYADDVEQAAYLPDDLKEVWKLKRQARRSEKLFWKKLQYFLRLPRNLRLQR